MSSTVILIALNVVAFALQALNQDVAIGLFGLWPLDHAEGVPAFHLWQVVSYSFLHGNIEHLFFNMFGLYMFGAEVERTLGRSRMLQLFFVSVLGGALVQLVVLWFTRGQFPTIGASAGVFGLLASYTMLYPKRRVMLLIPPIPMPSWLFATGYVLVELFLGVSGGQAGVAHFAHLGGVFAAILLLLYWIAAARHARQPRR